MLLVGVAIGVDFAGTKQLEPQYFGPVGRDSSSHDEPPIIRLIQSCLSCLLHAFLCLNEYKNKKDERLGFRQDYIGGCYDALQTPNPVFDLTTAERNVDGGKDGSARYSIISQAGMYFTHSCWGLVVSSALER